MRRSGNSMKLSLDPSVTAPRANTPESLALAAWYDANPAIRRMWAIKDAQALRVIVTLEPAVDSDDTFPAWLANSQAWMHELHSRTGSLVELQLLDELPGDEFEIDAEGDIVITRGWRDPALLFI